MIIISVRELTINDQEFYLDGTGKIKYNPLCESCPYDCKQSFRSQLVACNKKIQAKTKTEYLDEIKKQKKTVKDVAKAIGIHTRTLNSIFNNDERDIDFETHSKLMLELYNVDITDTSKKKKRRK